jgi:D-alanyl-D-alanine carboxypeptidase
VRPGEPVLGRGRDSMRNGLDSRTASVRGLLFCLVVLALGAFTANAHAGKRLDKLDRQLHKLVKLEEGPPGASALVQRRGRVDFLRAGVADLESGRPIKRNDHVRTASNGKAFSGAVALQLVDDGSLSLDSTIAEVLPDQPAAWGAVTLRQLLQHTSGVPNFTKSEAWQEFVRMNPQASVTPQFSLDFVADEPLAFTPGSRYEYSNSDNLIVGLMAEAVTGRTYGELLQELVFSPLRLKRTSLASDVAMPRPYVRGYDIAPPAPPEDISEFLNPAGFWAAGGMVSTQTELNRFIRAYASGRLIERSTKLEQRSFIPGKGGEPPGPGHNSGGLALYQYKTGCGTMLGHAGNFPGYTLYIAATPNGRRSAVVFASEQLAEDVKPEVFKQLRKAFRLATCAALPR